MTILEKIKALLAMAASTKNMDEAAAFAAKAHEMMEKYQVDVDAIRASDDPVGHDYAYHTKAKNKTWQMSLASATARYYGCRSVFTWHENLYKVDIFGRESARITSMEMLPYLVATVNRCAREMAATTGWDGYKCAKQIGLELSVRLRTLAPPMEDAERSVVVTGQNALIRLDEINAMVEDAYPNLAQGRKSKFSTSGLARQYANGINLSGQVAGSRSALKIGAR